MLLACGLATPKSIGAIFAWAHSADPDAQLCLNEWGVLEGNNWQGFVELAQALKQQGWPIHCMGVQVRV